MKAFEILHQVGQGIGLPANEFPDGGFCAGGPEDEVKGILVTWLATPEALRHAADRGLNLVVCHEHLYWSENEDPPLYRSSGPYRQPLDWTGHPNNIKRKIIEDNRLTVLQIHYGLDRLTIYDAFARIFGLEEVTAGEKYEKVFRLPHKTRLGDLLDDVHEKLGLEIVRYVGDENRMIEKVGNCWGGVGLFCNRYYTRRQIENGADAIICGELDEMAMFFAIESGVCLIETSHVLSENPGLKIFAEDLRQRARPVPVEFFKIELPYKRHVANSPK